MQSAAAAAGGSAPGIGEAKATAEPVAAAAAAESKAEVKEMQNYGPHTSGCMAKPPPAIPSHSRNALVIVSHTWNAILFISGNVADSNPTFFSWHWQFAFCIGESLYVIL